MGSGVFKLDGSAIHFVGTIVSITRTFSNVVLTDSILTRSGYFPLVFVAHGINNRNRCAHVDGSSCGEQRIYCRNFSGTIYIAKRIAFKIFTSWHVFYTDMFLT